VRVAPASEGSRSSASPLIEKRGENGEIQYYREIQDIRVGDEVLTYNEKTARMEYRRVTETFIHQTKLIFEISYRNGEKLETTWNHPFYIAGRGWVQAKDLRVNDRSLAVKELQEPALAFASRYLPTAMAAAALSDDDTGSEIVSIQRDQRRELVYNLEVDGTHAYFVGENGVLVHNYSGEANQGISIWLAFRSVTQVLWEDYECSERRFGTGSMDGDLGVTMK